MSPALHCPTGISSSDRENSWFDYKRIQNTIMDLPELELGYCLLKNK